MACEKFKEHNFEPQTLAIIERSNQIIHEYLRQHLRLTLRQLFYQMVARCFLENTHANYKALSSNLTNARYAGLMDWDVFEDRTRKPYIPTQFKGLGDLVDTAVCAYRLDRWAGQDVYTEIVSEKDAVSGVVSPLAREYHVPLVINRGFTSTTAMRETARRLQARAAGRRCVLLYAGDHDPSGKNMIRDVDKRLAVFGVTAEVREVALTMAQVRQHRLPPNRLKDKDPRAAEYRAEHGEESWELDALPPQVLVRMFKEQLDGVVNREAMDKVIAQEEADKSRLRALVANDTDEHEES